MDRPSNASPYVTYRRFYLAFNVYRFRMASKVMFIRVYYSTKAMLLPNFVCNKCILSFFKYIYVFVVAYVGVTDTFPVKVRR